MQARGEGGRVVEHQHIAFAKTRSQRLDRSVFDGTVRPRHVEEPDALPVATGLPSGQMAG